MGNWFFVEFLPAVALAEEGVICWLRAWDSSLLFAQKFDGVSIFVFSCLSYPSTKFRQNDKLGFGA